MQKRGSAVAGRLGACFQRDSDCPPGRPSRRHRPAAFNARLL